MQLQHGIDCKADNNKLEVEAVRLNLATVAKFEGTEDVEVLSSGVIEVPPYYWAVS